MCRRQVPFVLLVLMALVSSVTAAEFLVDYDDFDDKGLIAGDSPVLQPSGGIGDSPFMEGTRDGNYSPSFGAADPPATLNLLGDPGSIYGPEIEFSYGGRVFTVGDTPSPFRAMDFIHPNGTRWRLFFSDSVTLREANDWVQVDFTINTNWSDADAMTNGWETFDGTADDNVLTWAETLLNVDRIEFFAGWGATGGPATVAGIDNFFVRTAGPPPTTFTWNSQGSNDWNSATKWSPAGVPDTAEETAILGGIITEPRTVFTDTDVTINSLQFENFNSYVIAGPGNITLAANAASQLPTINVSQGEHQMQTSVSLAADTTVTINSGAKLIMINSLDLGGNTLTTSGTGELAIRNDLVLGGGTVVMQAGTVSGSGTVGGSVSNNGGTVSPGNSPGILTIDGDYTQGSNGTMAIEIGGLVPGDDHDKLVVMGDVSLEGTVAVELTGGYMPAAKDTFDVLDFSSYSENNLMFDFSLAGGPSAWDTSLFSSDGSLCFGMCDGPFTDYDNDGTWNLGDLNLVLFNWQNVEANLPPEWVNQRPAVVDLASLNNVLFMWQQSSSLSVVPEPSTALILVAGMLIALLGTSKRTS